MQFEIIGINPKGEQVDIPMTLGQLSANPYKMGGLLKKLQDRYGPGWKFMMVPLQRVRTEKRMKVDFFVDFLNLLWDNGL